MKRKINMTVFINRDKQSAEVVRFLFVGGTCFLLDYSLLYIFTEYVCISYLISAALSFIITLVVNYFLCAKWVFKQVKRSNSRRCVLFIGSSIVGLGINQACMWGFVELASMHYMIAKIFASVIVTVWNYYFKRKAIQN